MIAFPKPLWTIKALTDLFGGAGAAGRDVAGIAIDSRTVQPGDLFIALKGTETDGHAYVSDALSAGASAVIASAQNLAESHRNNPLIIDVPDTMEALRALAIAARDRSASARVAITGSVGKTSLVHALHTGLLTTAATHASVKSFNNHVGVPLSLARMLEQSEIAVFEVGMNAPGEIKPLGDLLAPHVGVVTTIAPAHLAQFESVAAIAKEKASLFEAVEQGGTAVYGIDHDYADILTARAKEASLNTISVSLDSAADVSIKKCVQKPGFSCLTADVMGQLVSFKVGHPGRAALSNAMLTLATAKALGADMLSVSLALSEIQPPRGRGRFYGLPLRQGKATLIDDSYNANPASFSAALERLDHCKLENGARTHIIAGDMLELGPKSDQYHAELLADLEERATGQLILVGKHLKAAANRLETDAVVLEEALGDQQQAILENLAEMILKRVRPGDVILIKGSNACGLSKLVAALRKLGQVASKVSGGVREAQALLAGAPSAATLLRD